MPLPQAPRVQPLVTALARALESGDRAHTESAAQRIVLGLAAALGAPPARVKVLAARPPAGWGELHGLYETTPRAAEPPVITLWMRTARQKRVVAFRTFLRTLLHEVGHHVDYTLLRLGDSLHTQGVYPRGAHLFHQLVTAGGMPMARLGQRHSRMARRRQDL